MSAPDRSARQRFRVWIVRYAQWQPESLRAVPPRAVAWEPAEPGTMSARQAASYAETFNRTASLLGRNYWAVVLPVQVRYEGEPQRGQELVFSAPVVN